MSIKTSKQSVMTQIWVGLALVALVTAMFQNNLKALNDAIVDSAKLAVGLAIALAGITALWLGLVKIIEKAGFMQRLARWIAPVMRRLFPNIPEGHAALSAMTLSFSANLLGLGNAATPFGLKAMTYLDDLNDKKDTASDSMCLFLAINTSGLSILPTGMIAIHGNTAGLIMGPKYIFLRLGNNPPGVISSLMWDLTSSIRSSILVLLAVAIFPVRRFH